MCFLTGVYGKFAPGHVTSIRLLIQDGHWVAQASDILSGATVGGNAACLETGSGAGGDTEEYSWLQGSPATTMQTTDNYACFLSGIQGVFQGGGESVTIGSSGTNYILSGSSQQTGVGAYARCIGTTQPKFVHEIGPFTSYATQSLETYGRSWYGSPGQLQVFPVCLLTMISGRLQSSSQFGGNSVFLTVSPQYAPNNWQGVVRSVGNWVYANATCIDGY